MLTPVLIAPQRMAQPVLAHGASAPAGAEIPTPMESLVLATHPEQPPLGPAVSIPAAAELGIASSIVSGIGGVIGRAISGWLAGVRFISFGTIYKLEQAITKVKEAIHKPLDQLPVPIIDRPFVIVPGWTTETKAFQPLVEHLTRNSSNGGQCFYVQQGAFYTMDANGDLQAVAAGAVPKDAKVFEMIFSDNRQAPDKNVVEMRANFDAIKAATAWDKFDVQGYSMGGINTRLYIDQGGDAVNRFLMLGTPNRGVHFANLARDVFEKDVRWAAAFGKLQSTDLDALTWLQPEDQSAPLADLNSRWPQQKTKVVTLTVGTDVMPTPSRDNLLGITYGDGLIDADSLNLPNSHTIVLHNAMQHGLLNDDETVQHLRAVYFGWGLPMTAVDPFPEGDDEYIQMLPPRAPATP